MPYTIVRPVYFMENWLRMKDQITQGQLSLLLTPRDDTAAGRRRRHRRFRHDGFRTPREMAWFGNRFSGR
jgi:hypothetical protein